MKNYLALFLLSMLFISCDNNSDETPQEITYPDNEGNFITVVSTINADGDTTDIHYMHHDGQRFTGYTRLQPNDQGIFEFSQLIEYTYDDAGRIVLAEIFYDEDKKEPAERLFEYTWQSDSYTVDNLTYDNGQYVNFGQDFLLYNYPQEGYRLVENDVIGDYLYGFEDGNHIGYAHLNSTDGQLEFDGRRWDFRQDFDFDDQPNALSDPAIDFMLGSRSLQRSLNVNNYIRYYYPDSNRTEEWAFVYGADKFRAIEYTDGSRVVVSYVPAEN